MDGWETLSAPEPPSACSQIRLGHHAVEADVGTYLTVQTDTDIIIDYKVRP